MISSWSHWREFDAKSFIEEKLMIYLRKTVSNLSVECYLTFVGNGRKVRPKYKNVETINWMKWNAQWYVREGTVRNKWS